MTNIENEIVEIMARLPSETAALAQQARKLQLEEKEDETNSAWEQVFASIGFAHKAVPLTLTELERDVAKLSALWDVPVEMISYKVKIPRQLHTRKAWLGMAESDVLHRQSQGALPLWKALRDAKNAPAQIAEIWQTLSTAEQARCVLDIGIHGFAYDLELHGFGRQIGGLFDALVPEHLEGIDSYLSHVETCNGQASYDDTATLLLWMLVRGKRVLSEASRSFFHPQISSTLEVGTKIVSELLPHVPRALIEERSLGYFSVNRANMGMAIPVILEYWPDPRLLECGLRGARAAQGSRYSDYPQELQRYAQAVRTQPTLLERVSDELAAYAQGQKQEVKLVFKKAITGKHLASLSELETKQLDAAISRSHDVASFAAYQQQPEAVPPIMRKAANKKAPSDILYSVWFTDNDTAVVFPVDQAEPLPIAMAQASWYAHDNANLNDVLLARSFDEAWRATLK